jgi:hypothetical protein
MRAQRWLAILPSLLLVTGLGLGADDEAANYRRLEAMPVERRLFLMGNLEAFDKLDAAEKAEIRRLDAAIARLDPVDQVTMRALLRRYHLWVAGLATKDRKALAAATSTDERFALALKLRNDQKEREKTGTEWGRVAEIRVGQIGLLAPHEAAVLLQVWEKLPPQKRLEIAKLYGPQASKDSGKEKTVVKALRELRKDYEVSVQRVPQEDDRLYDAKLETDAKLKEVLGLYFRRTTPKKALDLAVAKRKEAVAHFDLPLVELLYYDKHPPKPVKDRDLERFQAACPDWFLATVDPLSSDEARQYLSVVYRLIYPSPKEMPEPVKGKTDPAKKTPPAAKPVTKPATGNTGPL